MANSVIGALRINLGLDSAQFQDGLKNAQSRLSKFGATVRQGAMVAGAAMTAAGAAMGLAVKNVLDRADDMAKAAQKIGIPVDELSRLRHAADLSGVAFDGLQGSMRRLSANMDEAFTKGTGAAADAFNRLGISLTNADGTMRSSSEVLVDLSAVFQTMPDGAEKTALAMDLMGRAGADMIPLLNGGADALRGMMDEADKLGIVITPEMAKNAERFNDNLTRLQALLGGLVTMIAADLAEPLANFTDWLVEMGKGFADMDPWMREFISRFGSMLVVLAPIGAALAIVVAGIAAIGAPVALAAAGITALAAAIVAFWPEIQTLGAKITEFLEGAWTMFSGAWDSTIQKVEAVTASIVNLGTVAIEAMTAMVNGITEWVGGKLNAVWDGVASKVDWISGKFYNLYDAVVGNSYIPDMVEGIGHWMGQLDTYMVQPATAAIDTVQGRFATLASTIGSTLRSISGIMEREGGKQLGISKAFAVAEAVINTAVGVTKALAQGGFLGIAKAAAVAAAGFAQIMAIKSASRGGGGSVSRPAGGVSTAAEDQQPQGSQQTLNLTLRGLDRNALFSGEQVREFAQQLVDFQRDGGQLVLVDN